MNVKMNTPMGYMYLPDERMLENAKTIFAGVSESNPITERVLMGPSAKSNYRVMTPFGYAYLKNYNLVCQEKRIVNNAFHGEVARNISFVNAF